MSITQLFETVLKIILIVLGLIVAVPFIIWLDATIHQWLLSSLIQIIPESFTGCVDILVTTPDTSELLAILSIFATVTVTFLTLLFAIAAINASFRAGKEEYRLM